LGFGGGVLASEVWWRAILRSRAYRWPWAAVRASLAIPRAIHEVIWGLFFVNVLGLNPLAAIFGIAIPFGAITAKVFAEILDETPRRPFEALLNSGAPLPLAGLYGLLPQALPGLLSYAFYRVECAIRSAAVLGVIGAGGLGHEILLSFQSLRYREMWTLLWALVVLSGLVDLWSSQVRRRIGAANRIALAMKSTPTCASLAIRVGSTYRHDVLTMASFVSALILVPLSFWYVGADVRTLLAPRAAGLFAAVLRDSFPPALEAPLLRTLWDQSGQTLALATLAMVLASGGGALLAFPAARGFWVMGEGGGARRLGGLALVVLTRGVLLLCRAIPASVWALLMLFVFFPGLLPGALALGVYTLGVLGRLMAELIEDLDDRPLRALWALGASGPHVLAYGVLPRTLPGFVSYGVYRWEVCTRETVIVGVVGAAGLGRLLAEQLSNFDYPGVLTTVLFYIGLTVVVDWIGAAARRALR
jgi:phosphonate transport system permease protein